MLVEVLTRVVNVAGGVRALAAVHDLTESGEITFHWGEGVKGPVTIQTLGGNHFRMEVDLPKGKSTWLVTDGVGSKKEADHKAVPISNENAINIGNLTLPIAYVAAALSDPTTDVSLVGIEKRAGRSIYRLRLKGQLGLVAGRVPGISVEKDILVDALTFNIVSVGDLPLRTHKSSKSTGKQPDFPMREIEYGDFRVIDGVRVPFSISTKLVGQETLSIILSHVTFNSNLSAETFNQ
jgi:hypothetical protein